ncbi:MAG: sigma-70 family RNA polymerase sigma factor [Bacteroidetes bacterium]|nr:sigma-70 family RNA polymerase sigma factor [Bacteroidota bacterium]
MPGDDDIIQGCKRGDRKWQQELFLRYGRKLYGYCLRYAANQEDANDLLQDGFVKIFDSIGSFKGESTLEAWMTRLIINMAISRFRKRNSGPRFVEMDDLHIADDAEEIQVASYDLGRVLSALEGLPEKYRIVLNLYAIEKMSHKEIAEQLEISEGTSKSTLSRARQMLKDQLEGNKR